MNSTTRTIQQSEIVWSPSEAGDDKLTAIIRGYELTVGPDPDKKTFDWSVKATAEVSETPELIDAGTAKSEGGAKIATKEKLNKHLRQVAKDQRQAEAAKPKTEPKPMAAKKPPKPVSENDPSHGNPDARKAARQAAAAPKVKA